MNNNTIIKNTLFFTRAFTVRFANDKLVTACGWAANLQLKA